MSIALIIGISAGTGSPGQPGYDAAFLPDGDSSERDSNYIDQLQTWQVPYSDPYQIVAMGRKACQLGATYPDRASIEMTKHDHAKTYSPTQIHLIGLRSAAQGPAELDASCADP